MSTLKFNTPAPSTSKHNWVCVTTDELKSSLDDKLEIYDVKVGECKQHQQAKKEAKEKEAREHQQREEEEHMDMEAVDQEAVEQEIAKLGKEVLEPWPSDNEM